MDISLPMSLDVSSSAAMAPKASLCPPPPPRLLVTRAGGGSFPAAVRTYGPLKAQSRKPRLSPLQLSSSLHNEAAGGHWDSESAAREALSDYLRSEVGLPEEEAASIVSGAPKYVRSLVEGVEELDELPEHWGAFNHRKGRGGSGDGDGSADDSSSGGGRGFKEKVLYMAKQKDDGGKTAFLESIGLSLPSASYIARLVSSETLPALIHKVKIMKQILFSGRDERLIIGRNARHLMMNLSISVDDDIQQTLSFFEKMEAKRGGLDILDDEDAAFQYLIESFPRLLLLSAESHLKPVLGFLESAGVRRGSMRNIVLLFPPVLFYKPKDMKNKVFEQVAPAEEIGELLMRYPWIFSTSIQENYEKIVSFFEAEKVSRVSVDRAIKKWPHLLGCSAVKLKPMIDSFGELGIQNRMLGKVIATSPQLLLRKPDEFFQVVSLLEDIGFDRETVGKIMIRCPEVFGTSVEKTIRNKLAFLERIGISKCHLPRVIKKYPEVLVSDVDRTLLPRMNYLLEIGLSKREVSFMVRRFSPLLGYSIEEVFRPKVEFLINTMEKPLKEVVEYPRFFSYSLEKKIKPRHWALKGRGMEYTLKDALSKNDEEFAEFLDAGGNPSSIT